MRVEGDGAKRIGEGLRVPWGHNRGAAPRGGRSVYSVISIRSIRCLGILGFGKVRTEVLKRIIGTKPE
jgi:hypothetical protein